MQTTLAFMVVMHLFNYSPGNSGKNLFEIIFEKRMQIGRTMLFCWQNTTYNPYSPENIAFASTAIVCNILSNWIAYIITSIIYGALPLTFWLATKEFKVCISNACESLESVRVVFAKYNHLEVMIRSTNSVWAAVVLQHVMEMFLRIIWMHKYVSNGDIIRLVYFGSKTLFLVVGLLLMAEGCRFVI